MKRIPGKSPIKFEELVKCAWCGTRIFQDANVFFTDKGRPLDAGCYLTVFDEDIEKRNSEKQP